MLLAAIARGQVTLLPPATTPNVIRALRDFAPDAYLVADDPTLDVEMPRFDLAEVGHARAWVEAPRIPADREVACLFTSGSTGAPQPSFKTWGALVHDVRAEAARFAIGPGHAVLGTVPPHHRYGF